MSRILRAAGINETVKAGKTTLPGILTGISVNGELVIQEDILEDTSKQAFVVQGFTTQRVDLQLTLTGTPEEIRLDIASIQKVFQIERTKRAKVGDRATKLYPIRIVNPHLDARKIKTVLFDSFSTSEDDNDDAVRCTLSFREYDAEVAKLEDKELERKKQAAAKKKQEQAGAGAGGGTPNGLKSGDGKKPSGSGEAGPFATGFGAGVQSGGNFVQTVVDTVGN